MTNSIEVINLSKSYKSKQAVDNINFKINENEIVGLLGPNGCGKTTTIGMMLGLLKPTSGQVLINGMDIEKNKISLLHKMNFISPYIELPKKLTVRQNLVVYGKLYNVSNLNDQIDYLSNKLRLNTLLDNITGELSSVVKNKDGEVVEGDAKQVKRQRDTWTFSRDLSSSDPNWLLVATSS